jgi:CSLREA domain-containing protein
VASAEKSQWILRIIIEGKPAMPARSKLITTVLIIASWVLTSLSPIGVIPVYAASLVVNTAADADDGTCSVLNCTLREAITAANGLAGEDTITFADSYTITLASTLPQIAGNLTIDGSGHSVVVSGNDAVRVFNIQAGAVVTMSQLSIINGWAAAGAGGDNGGGIYNAGTLLVVNSTLRDNRAAASSPFRPGGGGIYNIGTLTVNNSTLSGNGSAFSNSGNEAGGGGIYNNNGTLTVNNSTISGNATSNNGGGIYTYGGPATINNSTFSGNWIGTGGVYGGGIINDSGTLTVTNSTFSGNSALQGGGIFNYLGTAITIHSTFSGNSATFGGGINNIGGILHLSNNLIANSPNGGDCYIFQGVIATNVNNLIEDGTCGPALSGDPVLSPLGNYGGSTQTHALLPGSPAINAADSATCAAAPVNYLDQRGVARPIGACDIGAFESRGFSLGSPTGTPQNATINTAFATPLGLTVSSSFGEPVGPGGQVTFTAPGSGASVTFAPSTVTSSDANGTISQTATANGIAGGYIVTATSRGASGSPSFNLINLLFTPVVTVSSSANPAVFGQSVTFTTTVSGNGSPVTGEVGFVIDGGAPVVVTLVNGQASLTTSTLTVRNHPITATYNGDANHYPRSGTLNGGQTINHAETATALISSVNPSPLGQSVTFTATVTVVAPGAGTPTGEVGFVIDGGAPISVTLVSGQASLTTSTLTLGNHPVTANYAGDANYTGSTSNTTDQVVNPADTTTTIASALNPSIIGQAVTFTATVTSTVGTPSGSVQFYADGAAMGSPVVLSNGQASLSTIALTVGTHVITATYSGDANHLGSTSNTIDQVVNSADATISIVSALNPSVVGQAVALTATVASAVGTPSGSVQFYADGATLGSPVVLSNGQASLSTIALTVGTHPITATYSGDADHYGSTSNTVNQVVNQAGTTTMIASALNPSIVGQAVTLTATVTSTVGTPSGSVQFYADGAALGSPVVLSNGQASLSTSALAIGTHVITATYSGDANHSGSISNQIDQIVTDFKVYLPVISRSFVAAPDLIVQNLTAQRTTFRLSPKIRVLR